MNACIGVICTCLGLVCAIISTSIPYWSYTTITVVASKGVLRGYYNWGLWENCKHLSELEDYCYSWSKAQSVMAQDLHLQWLHGCQALMIICVLAIGLDLFLAIRQVLRIPTVVPPGPLSILGGVCCLIAVVVFASKYTTLDMFSPSLHAGFGLAVVSVVFDIGGGVTMFKTIREQGGYLLF